MFECLDCKKTFANPAKKTVTEYAEMGGVPVVECQVESFVCPHCKSLNIVEVPQVPAVASVTVPEHVVIYEFTAERVKQGSQPELDKLLAEGFVPTEKFSKYWVLEKPKQSQKLEVSVQQQIDEIALLADPAAKLKARSELLDKLLEARKQ